MGRINRASIGFAVAIAILIVVAVNSQRTLRQSAEAAEWRNHTQAVLAAIEATSGSLYQVQSNFRGHLLTGDSRFLNRYHESAQTLDENRRRLGRLVADNAAQRRVLESFDVTSGEYLEWSRGLMRRRETMQMPDIVRAFMEPGRVQHVDTLQESLSAMRGTEDRLLAERDQRSAALTSRAGWLNVFGCLLALVVIALAWHRVAVQTRAREHAQELLNLRAEDLTRANADLKQFAYIASHDLQEPLRKLITFSQLLQKDIGGDLPPRAEADVQYITDAAGRMKRLIEDLLALSRSGRSELNVAPVSAERCVDRALASLATRIEETAAVIERDPLPHVHADETLLTQLFQNLVSNALKYMPPNRTPRIRITAARDANGWVLGVRDNGIGIRKEYHEQVFLPFKRLHGRAEYEGSGIGLAICAQVVRRHGGRMWIESEDGEGALSVHTSHTKGDGIMDAKLNAPADAGLVLIVEDDPADQELTRRALSDAPVPSESVLASNGEEALDYLLRRGRFSDPHTSPRPDLILLDLNMPRMNGVQTLREIRSHPDLRRIPVIVLTTSSAEEDISSCYELGCNSYITKPVTLDGYMEAVSQLNVYWLRLVRLPRIGTAMPRPALRVPAAAT